MSEAEAVSIIEYPSSDGKPMSETQRHRIVSIDVCSTLEGLYADRPDVFIGADLLLYYEEGNIGLRVSPDVFLAFGVPKLPLRDTYLLWIEGKAPDFVVEVTSRSTRRRDEGFKRDLYESLGVGEYWQFDPTGDYLDPILKGRRLAGGKYQAIEPRIGPRGALHYPSALGFEMRLEDGCLRLFDPRRREYLLSDRERAEADRKRAEAAERRIAQLEAQLRGGR